MMGEDRGQANALARHALRPPKQLRAPGCRRDTRVTPTG